MTGRYVTSDPIGLLGGTNSFSYALLNPVSLYDSLGLLVPPSLPQWLLDFSVGVADSVSFGIGRRIRNSLDWVDGGVDRCSAAYRNGEIASFVAGSGRALYAGVARGLPRLFALGANPMARAAAIQAARNTLKRLARVGMFPNTRMPTLNQIIAKVGPDPDAIIRSAQRTSKFWNALGFDAAGGAIANRATSADDCSCTQ